MATFERFLNSWTGWLCTRALIGLAPAVVAWAVITNTLTIFHA